MIQKFYNLFIFNNLLNKIQKIVFKFIRFGIIFIIINSILMYFLNYNILNLFIINLNNIRDFIFVTTTNIENNNSILDLFPIHSSPNNTGDMPNLSQEESKPTFSFEKTSKGTVIVEFNESAVNKFTETITKTIPTVIDKVGSTAGPAVVGAASIKGSVEITKAMAGSPVTRGLTVVGLSALTTGSVTLAASAAREEGRNLREFLNNHVANSRYNQNLPDGRAPSPNPEFNIHSMLDNLELSNFNFSFNLPTGDLSPLEALLSYISISAIIILILALYLGFLFSMQLFSKNYSAIILNYFNIENNNLSFMPKFIKKLLFRYFSTIFNLHTSFYKYVILFVILLLIFNIIFILSLCIELIANLNQYVAVYQNYN